MRRLAVTQTIPNYILVTYQDVPRFKERIKDDLKRRMGIELVNEIEQSENPMVVRMSWVNSTVYNTYEDSIRVGLQADLIASTVMNVVIPNIPEPSWAFLQEAIVEWQCGYCGQVNIIKEHLECRRCGAPRRALR